MILPTGRENAAKQRQLARVFGISVREVQQAIQEARLAGVPVCSGDEGIWVEDDPQDVADMAQRLRRRAINQLLTARALRATAKRMASPREVPVEEPSLWSAA